MTVHGDLSTIPWVRPRAAKIVENARQEAHLVALLKSGEYSSAELGDLFGVARSTVYRAVERDAARNAPSDQRRLQFLNGQCKPP